MSEFEPIPKLQCPKCSKESLVKGTFEFKGTYPWNEPEIREYKYKCVNCGQLIGPLSINIEVHTSDHLDLYGKNVKLSDQIIMDYKKSLCLNSVEAPDIIYLTLSYLQDVPSEVIAILAAEWLRNKFRGKHVDKLVIEKTEVELDEGEIKRIIHETTKYN